MLAFQLVDFEQSEWLCNVVGLVQLVEGLKGK